MTNLEKNFDEIIRIIEKTRLEVDEHRIIKIIAVSKYVEPADIKSLYSLGQRAFGENKVQDLIAKSHALEALPIEWHFIGRLQTNKINHLIDLFPALLHSCESYEMAQELDKRLQIKNKKMNILLQINSAKEESKAGIMPESAVEEYLKIKEDFQNINLKGVMSIGAHSQEQKEIQNSFETTHAIFEKLQQNGAQYCSMGMSNDFELAIKCGSNMLRLGSILFDM